MDRTTTQGTCHAGISPHLRTERKRVVDWVIRVEETRVGVTDDKQHVIILTHIRARGSNADWTGVVTRANGGAVVYRDTAPDAETLTLLCKDAIKHAATVNERDPYTHNERDPADTT